MSDLVGDRGTDFGAVAATNIPSRPATSGTSPHDRRLGETTSITPTSVQREFATAHFNAARRPMPWLRHHARVATPRRIGAMPGDARSLWLLKFTILLTVADIRDPHASITGSSRFSNSVCYATATSRHRSTEFSELARQWITDATSGVAV